MVFLPEPVEAQDFGRITDRFWRNLWNKLQIGIEKPKDVNMSLVGLANTRISTDHAQKSPRSLFCATFGEG